MLKLAFQLGMKLAYEEAELSPQQMAAAKRLAGVGGLVAGGAGGALLGKYLGGEAAKALAPTNWFGIIPSKHKSFGEVIGALLGGAAGAGIGHYTGEQIPVWLRRTTSDKAQPAAPRPFAGQSESERALWLVPSIYSNTPDQNMIEASGFDDYYPEY